MPVAVLPQPLRAFFNIEIMTKLYPVKCNRGGLLICALLASLLLNACTYQKIALINPKPTTNLAVYTDKPVYYYVQDTLYYAPHGELDLTHPIWQGKITERFYDGKVLVSPDSRYVLIHHEGGLDVIDSAGTKIWQAKNVNQSLERLVGNFWNKDFQWGTDSKDLYLVKDLVYSFGGDHANRSVLIKLDMASGSLSTVYEFTERSWHYYLGPHNTLYYTGYNEAIENWQLKKVDLKTKLITLIDRDDDQHTLKTTDTIYANLKFEQREYDNHLLIGNRSYEECNVYAIGDNGTEQLLFEVQCGSNSWDKSKRFHLQEMNAEVYLSDKYYFGKIYTAGYQTLIVDLKTLQYNFYKEYIKPYVASTIETGHFIYTWGELMIKK